MGDLDVAHGRTGRALVRWNLHPADIITHRFPLERAVDAYALMASGKCGKVAVCFDEELHLEMSSQWEDVLKDRLPLYGHRNWIVIADSAYPAQSSDGVETIVSDGEQTAVIARTFALLSECRHIKPTIYTDRELNFVSEADAQGVTAYRGQLERS